jgi:hypothetical protein
MEAADPVGAVLMRKRELNRIDGLARRSVGNSGCPALPWFERVRPFQTKQVSGDFASDATSRANRSSHWRSNSEFHQSAGLERARLPLVLQSSMRWPAIFEVANAVLGEGGKMATCETCGNDYDKAFQVVMNGKAHTFDSFECAIHALAPTCERRGTRIVGHGLEKG